MTSAEVSVIVVATTTTATIKYVCASVLVSSIDVRRV